LTSFSAKAGTSNRRAKCAPIETPAHRGIVGGGSDTWPTLSMSAAIDTPISRSTLRALATSAFIAASIARSVC
jgi:hypothetical protein